MTPQVENPIRTTNKSLIKLTQVNGHKPEEVYKVRRSRECGQALPPLVARVRRGCRGAWLLRYKLGSVHNVPRWPCLYYTSLVSAWPLF